MRFARTEFQEGDLVTCYGALHLLIECHMIKDGGKTERWSALRLDDRTVRALALSVAYDHGAYGTVPTAVYRQGEILDR